MVLKKIATVVYLKLVGWFLVLVFIMGCTTIPLYKEKEDRVSVNCDGRLYFKNNANFLPDDFPDELFIKWFCKKAFVAVIDRDGDGTQDIMCFWYHDVYDQLIAIWFFEIIKKQDLMTFAFVEVINDRAVIVWVARYATDDMVEWLDRMIHALNYKIET